MRYSYSVILLVLGLFIGMLLLLTVGQRLGRQNLPKETDAARALVPFQLDEPNLLGSPSPSPLPL